MPGLLDDDLFNDPKKLGLLTMGLSLLSTPGRFGESFGRAGLQGVQATRGAMKDAQQSQMAKLQLDEAKQKALDAQQAREMEMRIAQTAQNFLRPPQPARPGTADLQSMMPQGTSIGAMQPIPAQQGGFDTQGFLGALPSVQGMNPLKAIETQAKYRQMLGKENQINKLDAKDFTPSSLAKFAQSGNYGDLERLDKLHFGDTGGQIAAFNPFTGTKVTATPKTGDPFKDLLVSDANGQLVPNRPLIGAKSAVASAGASKNTIINSGQKGFDNEQGLRKEFQGLPESKGYAEVRQAWDQIRTAIDSKSPAGDLAAATKFMKLLDPGSVVRESELGMAMSATGAVDRLQNFVSMMASGEKLTAKQRADFRNVGEQLHNAARDAYIGKTKFFRERANEYQLNPDAITEPQWKIYGYRSREDAIKDARNAAFKNPQAKPEIIRRLVEDMGITDHGVK